MDSGRKDLGDKVSEKTTPENSKSTTDKLSEGVTNTADKAQRDLTSDQNKTTGQAMADKTSREKDAHSGSNESVIDKAKNAVGMGDKK